MASRQQADAYTAFENQTFELPIIYRSAISNILPGHYWGDIYGGVEFKTLHRTTFFDNVDVANGDADLFQIVLGWSDTFTDRLGRTMVDARIKANPGGVLGGNDAATWSSFTNGRVDSVTYVYGALDVTRVTRLPRRFSWVSRFSGIWSGQPLPDTEQLSLGGFYGVRGYNYDDASVDSGLIWRNELRLPSFAPLQRMTDMRDDLSPYLFADLGYGKDNAVGYIASLASLGAGFDYSVADNFTGSFAAGYALKNAGATKAGDWKVQVDLTAKF